MSRTMIKATETGLLICERISDEGMKYISEWDPDLHYALTQARKKKKRKTRKTKNEF